MQIQATKEKELCTARTGLSIAEQGIRVSEEHLTALHMDSDEECDENYDLQKAAPLPYLTASEKLAWNRLTWKEQQSYLEEGIRETRKEQLEHRSWQRQPEMETIPWQGEITEVQEETVRTTKILEATSATVSEFHETEEGNVKLPERMQERKELGESLEKKTDIQSGQLDKREFVARQPVRILHEDIRIAKSDYAIGTQMRREIFKQTKAKYSERMDKNICKSPRRIEEAGSVMGAYAKTLSTESIKGSGATAAGTSLATGTAIASTNIPQAAAAIGKKTAETFRAYLQKKAMLNDYAVSEAQKHLEAVKEENKNMDTLPSAVRYTAAGIGAVLLSAIAAVAQAAMSLLMMLLSSTIAFLLPLLLIMTTVMALISLVSAITSSESAGYGLPSFVTEDMMQAFFEVQEEKGIPVSSGIAQLIAESGFGSYGPGGENGEGLSRLAYDYKNLFGIKYSQRDTYAVSVVNMTTGEQTPTGGDYQIVAGFSVYPDYAACIQQRGAMLSRGNYAQHVGAYLNPNDGTYTKDQAKLFVAGIREAGWATSLTYTETCISIMDRYQLYQFDNMTYETYQQGAGDSYNGEVTEEMQRIVDTAKNNAGVYPCTPDYCARWVTGVYMAANAGTIPRGNAIDMWNTYKTTGSTSMENIPPGAIVCGSGSGYMGSIYGHVGIYLGNGMVANNVGHFSIESLSDWCAWQRATCQGHTGWIGWVYPGGVPQK